MVKSAEILAENLLSPTAAEQLLETVSAIGEATLFRAGLPKEAPWNSIKFKPKWGNFKEELKLERKDGWTSVKHHVGNMDLSPRSSYDASAHITPDGAAVAFKLEHDSDSVSRGDAVAQELRHKLASCLIVEATVTFAVERSR